MKETKMKTKTHKPAKFQTPHEQATADRFVWKPGDVVVREATPEEKRKLKVEPVESKVQQVAPKAKRPSLKKEMDDLVKVIESTKTPTPKEAKKEGRDAFGGRLGTRMSKINLVVIKAGEKGATVPEVAKETGETASIVGAQLSWIVNHHKRATRKQETVDGKNVFRYFAIIDKAQKL
jgi:hypothetical protein